MKTYAVSFVSFFENLLDIRKIKANNAKVAMIMYLRYVREWDCEDWLDSDITEEEIRKCVSEQDCSIAFLEIS